MIGEIVGLFLMLAGVLCTAGGCMVWAINRDGGIVFWFGLAMVAFGWILNHTTATKTCPWCSQRISYRALRCKHCEAALSK